MARKRMALMGHVYRVPNTQRIFGSADAYNMVRVQMADGRETVLALTDNGLALAERTAAKNPEDQPRPYWWLDLVD